MPITPKYNSTFIKNRSINEDKIRKTKTQSTQHTQRTKTHLSQALFGIVIVAKYASGREPTAASIPDTIAGSTFKSDCVFPSARDARHYQQQTVNFRAKQNYFYHPST
jgi:hypothetical protein